ncbi:hypothetical protein GGX14DRAFT_561959 [Mycena pura]|uniref:Uncharacterized protein n=1 Tax=Mycena pura TaxID=153505 RepID=A0AAD6VL91_9AGAR|nr:hypothetical protein GGX14DRAFT_561959 [Mycena pura]
MSPRYLTHSSSSHAALAVHRLLVTHHVLRIAQVPATLSFFVLPDGATPRRIWSLYPAHIGNRPVASVKDLTSKMDDIQTQLADVASKGDLAALLADALKTHLGPAAGNAAALAPPSNAPVPPVPPPFTPPIAPLNSVAGVSSTPPPPSLVTLFPDVEPACITSVITHTLRASDLYKLNPRTREEDTGFKLSELSGTIEVNVSKHKTYKTLNSVFFRYLSHITELAVDYEWSAIYVYHALFFNRRLADMASGTYTTWGEPDIGLLASKVYPHRCAAQHPAAKAKTAGSGAKAPPSGNAATVCRNYNAGSCQSPCAHKGQHGPGLASSISPPLLTRRGHPVGEPINPASLASASLPHSNLFPPRTSPPARPNTDPVSTPPLLIHVPSHPSHPCSTPPPGPIT